MFLPKLDQGALGMSDPCGTLPLALKPNAVPSRVSQKTQKSEFWFATNPTGFHRLDEPPEKISAL